MSSDQPARTEAAATIMRFMNGAWIARIVHTAAEIAVADHLDDQPRDAQWVAAASGTHAPSLARLLRALAALGIVQETDQLQYTLTSLGAALRSDAPGSMRGWARMILSEMDERPWQALTHAVRTGDYAFHHAFGIDAWSYRAAHPDNSRLFDEAMRSMTESVNAAVATSYPFKEFGWIVDVGGGNGALLLAILAKNPETRGTVFELPHVALHARERIAASDVSARCDVMEGDAMTSVPSGADAYVVKGVIHGRSDDETVTILRNCRAAMPPHGKLLLVERLMPERVDPEDARAHVNLLVDINMMLMAPAGRERREAEHRRLIARAGLQVSGVLQTSSPMAIIEATPGG
jgi:hypothetical protein